MFASAERIHIRPAHRDERDALEALQWRASLTNEADRPHLEANPDAIHLSAEQIERGDVLVAEYQGAIAGFAALEGGELDGLFVEPSQWRRGVGSALVDAATHRARIRGLTLSVIAHPAARGFYERCGFAFESEAETRFGPAIRMSR
jgi:GNAT superfamily N-acetyltransferase